jgi:hypothetical protein
MGHREYPQKNSFRMHFMKLRGGVPEKSSLRQYFFGFYSTLAGIDYYFT